MSSRKGTCRNPTEREAVRQLAMQGLSIREVAEALGVPYDRAKNHMTYLMNSGVIPPAVVRKRGAMPAPNKVNLKAERVRRAMRYGSMVELLCSLSAEQFTWLIDQVPEGGTMVDIVRACVVDAYEEEKRNE